MNKHKSARSSKNKKSGKYAAQRRRTERNKRAMHLRRLKEHPNDLQFKRYLNA